MTHRASDADLLHYRNDCVVRRHEIGARVWLWEMLPDRLHDSRPIFGDEEAPRAH